MPSKKYRLAAPIDDNDVIMSYRLPLPTAPLPLPQLTAVNNNKLSSRSVLLNNEKTVEKVPCNPSERWWLVLPCVLLITLVSASDPLLMNDLIVRRYKRYYGLNASPDTQRTACLQSVTTPNPIVPILYWQFPYLNQNPLEHQQDYDLVQRDAASFNIKNAIATVVPAVVTFILFGSNSDIIGRRPLLVLPFLGKVVRYSFMLIIVSRDLSNSWLIATHALEAIFGSEGLVILSALAYITDCTNKSRTRAFFVTEVMTVIARIIPVLAVSVWLRHHLYTVPLSVDLILSVIGLLYALLIQPESVESVKNISFVRQLARVRLKPIIRVITVFTVKRSGSKRKHIILLTIVTIVLLFILFGYTSVFALYLYGHPFCLDAFNVGLLSLAQAITISLTSLLIVLCKKTLNDTYILPLIGSFALIVGLILFSVAKRMWLLYIAACIGSLFFVALPTLRTKLTKLVEVNEYATVFIAAGIVETVGYQAVGAIANHIYKSSLHFFPGLVFLVFAITGICPLAIMIYLTFSETKPSTNNNAKASMQHNHISQNSETYHKSRGKHELIFSRICDTTKKNTFIVDSCGK